MKRYCLGFAFSKDGKRVALIKKARPDFQAGKWNGIGGKVNPEENPQDAMSREFREETGVRIDADDWMHYCRFGNSEWAVNCFRVFTDDVETVKTTTDEEVQVWPVEQLPFPIMNNLRFLIPLAQAENGIYEVKAKVWEKAA